MTTPVSGAIYFTDLQNEFGGSSVGGLYLSKFYANGNYVNRGLGSITSSGAITLAAFYNQTNVTSFTFSQTGISASNGYATGQTAPGNENGYGPYLVRGLANCLFTSVCNITSMNISISGVIDLGYRIFAAINRTWDVSPYGGLFGIYDPGGGQSFQSGSSTVPFSANAGDDIQIGYSTGPAWQQIISGGVCTITYNKRILP